jgi:hypothetical protein
MKKFLLAGVLLMGAASLASADDFSFSLSFGDGGRGWRPRQAYCARPVYYRPVYRTYAYRPVYGYRPGYYYQGGRWAPRRNYVVVRSCD